MMTELTHITQELVALSCVLAGQIALVLLLRIPVRRWLGAVACYRLWLLPLLWMPFYWTGPRVLETLAGWNLEKTAGNNQSHDTLQQFLQLELLPSDLIIGTTVSATSGFGAGYAWVTLGLLWISGSVGLVIWQGRSWLNFSRKVNALAVRVPASECKNLGVHMHFNVEVPVLYLQEITSAALFGIFRPILLLADSFTQRYDHSQRHIILAHEAIHLRRDDNGWNLCALLILVLFWTNPLVLLGWRYYRLDQELSCDALALSHCDKQQQKRYARTLLDSLGSLPATSTPPALSAWDKLRDLKQRSFMIKQHLLITNRPATSMLTLSLLLVFGGFLTITSAQILSPPLQAAEALPMQEANANNVPLTSEDVGKIKMLSIGIKELNEGKLERMPLALDAFTPPGEQTKLLLQNLPHIALVGTSYAIAQARLAMGGGASTVEYLSRAIVPPNGEPPIGPLYLISAAYYQTNQYEAALPYIEKTISLSGAMPQENLMQMMFSVYRQTGRLAQARTTMEKMVELYDKPEFQDQLDKLGTGDNQ